MSDMPGALYNGAPGDLYQAEALLKLRTCHFPRMDGFLVADGNVLKDKTWWKLLMTDDPMLESEFQTVLDTGGGKHTGHATGVDAVILYRTALEDRDATRARESSWLVEVKVGAAIGPGVTGGTACVAWHLARAGVRRRWMLVCPKGSEVQRILRGESPLGTLFDNILRIEPSYRVQQLQRVIRECEPSRARMYELLAAVARPLGDGAFGDSAVLRIVHLQNSIDEIREEVRQWHARHAHALKMVSDAKVSRERLRDCTATERRLAAKHALRARAVAAERHQQSE